MAEKTTINRRQFLATTATAAAFTIVPRHVLGGPDNIPPSEKLNIAGIGVGGMGFGNLKNMESENIVALCDVDAEYASRAFKRYPKAKVYTDYRVMLEKQKDIDAVLIATPDHTHAVITIAALQADKHVYCQKPLTHNITEARKVAAVAKETNVITQMGIQGHSTDDMRRVCEWIWDGAIGDIREVEAWSKETYYPWGHAFWATTEPRKPKETPPVPSGLNWDLWLGPAANRPYHPCYHPARWRAWWDFGCGWMGDRGVHTMDAIFWALKLGHPESISASVTDYNEDINPIASIVTYKIPARGELPPVRLIWYEGVEPPRPDDLEDGRKLPKDGGILFKGDKGTIMCGVYAESPQIIPYEKMKNYEQPAKTLRRISGTHENEWIQAIKENRPACADFEYAAQLTEFVLLGNIAKRTQSHLKWDGPNMRITNNEEANQYLSRQYRSGWSV